MSEGQSISRTAAFVGSSHSAVVSICWKDHWCALGVKAGSCSVHHWTHAIRTGPWSIERWSDGLVCVLHLHCGKKASWRRQRGALGSVLLGNLGFNIMWTLLWHIQLTTTIVTDCHVWRDEGPKMQDSRETKEWTQGGSFNAVSKTRIIQTEESKIKLKLGADEKQLGKRGMWRNRQQRCNNATTGRGKQRAEIHKGVTREQETGSKTENTEHWTRLSK